jgi:predicted nucleotide-binding protein (sugar kinase/HSP70/actin superfamily)
MDIITLEVPHEGISEFYRRCLKISKGSGIIKLVHAFINSARVSLLVDDIERLCFMKRAFEEGKNTTDKLYREFKESVSSVRGSKSIIGLARFFRERIMSINTRKDKKPLKVGIVGEIYTTIDPFINFYIQERLGRMGVWVDRSLSVSGWVVEHIIKKGLGLAGDKRYEKAAKPYLKKMIGGHAQETIGNTVLYAKNNYDGVIQIYPLTCMPEIAAQAILPTVSDESGIPVLTLIIDEMTADTGYMTRIEAFLELLERRREKFSGRELPVLSGY